MIDQFERYAIYFAPEYGSDLARLGNQWLGLDPESGTFLERPEIDSVGAAEIEEITRSPARYGFHGTLKPPFYLDEDRRVDELELAVELLARNTAPFELGSLALRSLNGFLALIPEHPPADSSNLANACVANLDIFRRVPSDAELARRRKNLSGRQEKLLRKWGYPYVFEEFRFHMTLTERLELRLREKVEAALTQYFEPIFSQQIWCKEICLFGDPGNAGPFRLLGRYPLVGRG